MWSPDFQAVLGGCCLGVVVLVRGFFNPLVFCCRKLCRSTKMVATKRFTPGATVLPPPLISGGGNGGGPPKRKKKDSSGMVGANMFCLCSACCENVFMCVSSFVRSACCHIVFVYVLHILETLHSTSSNICISSKSFSEVIVFQSCCLTKELHGP